MKLFTISAILEEKVLDNPQAIAVKDDELLADFEESKSLLEKIMRNENCVQMEGTQIYIYGLLRVIQDIFINSAKAGDYFNLARKIRALANMIFCLSSNCYLLLIEVLRSRNKIEISQDGPYLHV